MEVEGECEGQRGDGCGDKPAAGSGVVASEYDFYRFDITDFRLVRQNLFFIHFPSALY